VALAWRALPVVVLSVLTWLCLGYRYEIWPQPELLVFSLRYDGQLQGDWFADGQPVHWAVSNLLGLLPHALLEPAVAVLYVLAVVVLWAGWMQAAAALRVGATTAVAAGLVAIPTAFAGFGETRVLLDYFYPTALGCAFAVLALGLLLRHRLIAGGTALGLAVALHPGVGVLYAAAIVPVGLAQAGRRPRELARFAVPLALLGLPALGQTAVTQAFSSGLSAAERFDLVAVVRAPHHFLYSAFGTPEYVAVALWTAVAAAGYAMLRRDEPVRRLGLAVAAAAAVCAVGAVASALEGPLLLVQLQTARVSSVFVIAGLLLGAALLTRLAPRAAAPALLGAFAVTSVVERPLREQVAAHAPGLASSVTASSVEAGLVLVLALGATAAVRHGRTPPRWWAAERAPLAATALAALAALAVVLDDRPPLTGGSVQDDALHAVAAAARARTAPRDVVLVPPGMDNFTTYARRPTVVTFGAFPFGKGDDEWVRRLVAVTGRPDLLRGDPLGPEASRRVAAAEAAYARRLRTTPAPLCAYRVRAVVAPVHARLGPWLRVVYRNGTYELATVAATACA
jgi:hypothetical protein